MSELRIAYAINSLEGGGAAAPLPAILSVLRDAGAEIRLLALTRRNGKALPKIGQSGIAVRVRNGGEKDHFSALRWLQAECADWGATHLWTSLTRATLLGQIVGQRLAIPVVSWQHNAFLKPMNEVLLRWRADYSQLWIADSTQVAELTALRLHVPPARLVTWPIFDADPQAPRARAWQPGETVRIGSLGRLHPAKGYDILIEALALLRRQDFAPPMPFRVLIAGEGALHADLTAKCVAAKIDNLDFVGFSADPRDFLADCHLYVQPSRREGFCIAAHEAMQAGLPCIVSATGEMARTVRPGRDGMVVLVEDAGALAEALRGLLSDPANLAILGRNAHERVLDLYPPDQFREIGSAIIELLRGRDRHGSVN